MYSAGVLKQPFYLRVQVPRNLQSFRISVWSQQAGHLVISQVYTVRPLIYEYSHRRIRHGVRDKASHRLHDQGIADDQTNAFRVAADASLRENRASVEPDELHETDPTHGILNDLLHFRICRRRGHVSPEIAHVRLADGRFHGRYHTLERLLRRDAPSLNTNLSDRHVRFNLDRFGNDSRCDATLSMKIQLGQSD